MKTLATASFVALFSCASASAAQCPLGDVSPSDGSSGDEFGSVLALDGDWLAVGAPSADAGGVDRGAVYVYERDGAGGWIERQILTSSDPADFDRFGWSVALEDDLLVAGVLSDDDLGFDCGSAYVFERNGSTWSETQKLVASNGGLGDLFGISLDLSDERIVIGACQRSLFELFGIGEGMVYVFERSGATFAEVDVLVASDGSVGDFFGAGVAIDADRIVVGAEAEDDAAQDAGALYVFDRVSNAWSERAKIIAADGGVGDFLGMRVDVDGDRIVAAAPTADVQGVTEAGAAYVFDGNSGGTSWSEVLKIVDASPGEDDLMGMGLALDGELILVGGPSAGPTDAGRALLFRDDGGSLAPVAVLEGSSGGDGFGWAAELDGDYMIVGAQGESGSGRGHELLHVRATATTRTAGNNPLSLTAGIPLLGEQIIVQVDLGGTSGHAFAGIVGFYQVANVSLPGGQVLLVDPTSPGGELLGSPVLPGPLASFTLLVPGDPSACGSSVSIQALHFSGAPFALSNAVDCIVGS